MKLKSKDWTFIFHQLSHFHANKTDEINFLNTSTASIKREKCVWINMKINVLAIKTKKKQIAILNFVLDNVSNNLRKVLHKE